MSHREISGAHSSIGHSLGVGALHVIRISGDASKNTVEAFLNKPLQKPRHASLRYFSSEKVEDQVVAIWYSEPHSYTGEEMVEIMCHGNPAIAELIIETLWMPV